ncbi:MAG: methionyl-tRNA formyltransferase [bacterium]|nr:methionyl-tRNA formyltransferase [bacterium]
MAKILFMGTPDFALPCLDALIHSHHQVSLVLCQPDRKKGRGHKMLAPPVKERALAAGIEVFQPEKIRHQPEVLARLQAEEADFFVVVAYGKILPQEVLDLPKKGCINVHASLLPKLRGAAPIQFSLLEGHQQTGVCTMLMDAGMDTGALLQCAETPIGPNETAETLTPRLAGMGAKLLLETLDRFDQLTPRPQAESEATYARLITKEDRQLDWSQPARDLFNRFRALSPVPGVVTQFKGKGLALLDCRLAKGHGAPGEVIEIGPESFKVACGSGALEIVELRPESKKSLSAQDFTHGYQLQIGQILGGQ